MEWGAGKKALKIFTNLAIVPLVIDATGQDPDRLRTALRSSDTPTSDLVELAVNCAHDG